MTLTPSTNFDSSTTPLESVPLVPVLSSPAAVPSKLGRVQQHVVAPIEETTNFDQTPATLLRVLHLINGEHFAGAERVQQLLGNRLHDFGIASDFVCLKPGKFPELSGLPSDRVHVVPMKSRFDLSSIGKIAGLAKSGSYDLLHAHTPRAALIASLVSRRLDLPWVYHVHSPAARDSTRYLTNRINDWVESISLIGCQKLITVSKSLRREMLGRGWSRRQVEAIANGVAEQPSIDAESRRGNSTWRLGIVALFRPRKGIEVLLRALAKLPPGSPCVQLDVIGGFETPEYEAQVHSLVEDLKLRDSVRFLGFTKDVTGSMRTLDGLVLPSLFGEGMPMVVLEALAVGVPVIATRVEGTPEVVRDGREGVLAEPQDAESLSQAISKFISDRQAWCEMSRNAHHRHREKFSDVQMAERTARAYYRLSDTQRL